MELIDAHCHLEAEVFEGRHAEVLREAREAGLVGLVTHAVTPAQWPQSKALAEAWPEVAFAWGIHPWFVDATSLEAAEGLRDAKAAGASAIGEIGLDAKIAVPMPLQGAVFERQLHLAKTQGLPVSIHCRGAFAELLAVLNKTGPLEAGGLIHAFSGSAEIAQACLPFGLAFSMGASLSYKKSKKRMRVLDLIYPDHLLLETDSPDMPPAQAPDKPNRPANIRHNLRGAAALLGVAEAEIAGHTTRNARRIFQRPFPPR